MSWITAGSLNDVGFSLKAPKSVRKVVKKVGAVVKKALPIAAVALSVIPGGGAIARIGQKLAAGKTAAKVTNVASKVQKVRKTVLRKTAPLNKPSHQVVTVQPAADAAAGAPPTAGAVVSSGPVNASPDATSATPGTARHRHGGRAADGSDAPASPSFSSSSAPTSSSVPAGNENSSPAASAESTGGGIPPWAIPVGIGALVLGVMAMRPKGAR